MAAIIGLNKVNMQTVMNASAGFKESKREMQSAFPIGDEILIISSHQSWSYKLARKSSSLNKQAGTKGPPESGFAWRRFLARLSTDLPTFG